MADKELLEKSEGFDDASYNVIGASDIAFNRSSVYSQVKLTTQFWLSSFQSSPNGRKGFSEVERISFDMSYDTDPDMSGTIDGCLLTIYSFDGYKQLIKLDEIDPAELYWAGKAFLSIAKRFGIDYEQQEEENKKQLSKV